MATEFGKHQDLKILATRTQTQKVQFQQAHSNYFQKPKKNIVHLIPSCDDGHSHRYNLTPGEE